jgi:hypothetical protein
MGRTLTLKEDGEEGGEEVDGEGPGAHAAAAAAACISGYGGEACPIARGSCWLDVEVPRNWEAWWWCAVRCGPVARRLPIGVLCPSRLFLFFICRKEKEKYLLLF